MNKNDYIRLQSKRFSKAKKSFISSAIDEEQKKLDLMDEDFQVTKNVITRDNIHLYYEFMSEQDLIKNRKILDEIFDKRRGSIKVSLTIGSFELSNHEEFEHGNYRFIYKCSFFGAKDTLKPIDEYIADIKASSEYKEYKKNTHLTKDEIRNYRTGMMPNSPNYRKQCAANRLRS